MTELLQQYEKIREEQDRQSQRTILGRGLAINQEIDRDLLKINRGITPYERLFGVYLSYLNLARKTPEGSTLQHLCIAQAENLAEQMSSL